jgi:hypothetical protein
MPGILAYGFDLSAPRGDSSPNHATFLGSWIKGAHDAGVPSTEAVAMGLQRTGPNHYRGAPSVLRGDRRVRDIADHLHQGAWDRQRGGRAGRRDGGQSVPGAVADGTAGPVELVGAAAAAMAIEPGGSERGYGDRGLTLN